MDKSIVVVEESDRRNDPMASASKSCSGSLVHINSIAIDINCPVEEIIESPKHEHFSIRGFVSEMRKKDRKLCLPFASEGEDNNDHMDLPPLSVPKFRWWRCSDCVLDNANERNQLAMVLADRNEAGSSSYQNVINIGENENDGLLTLSAQNKGDGHGNFNYPTDKIVNSKAWCTGGYKATTYSGEKENVGNNEGGNLCTHIIEANPVQEKETHNENAAQDPSSDDAIAFSALPHKRKPKLKLRSLADIMDGEKNLTSEHTKTRSSSSSGLMQVRSTEVEADLSPQPHVEAPLDVAKVTKSPQRKRKFGLEEDRGPLETISSIATAKRSKGTIFDAEYTSRRVENTDSDLERDRPTRFDSRIIVKAPQKKPRKNKAFDINRKSRTVTNKEVPMINSAHPANLQKYPVAAETSYGNLGHVGPCFKDSLSGQQMDNISDLSKGKRPVEGGYISFKPPTSKSSLGDCNEQEKVVLDLSLNSYMSVEGNSDKQDSFRQQRILPDLNESIVEKTSMTEGQQLPTFHENLDTCASSRKETITDGKRQLGISEQQVLQNMDTSGRLGASDDIPMEIVELLAKNQHERALDNSRKHLVPGGMNTYFKGSSSVYAETNPRFPYTNKKSGASGNNTLNLNFQNNSPLEISDFDKSQLRHFHSLTPAQQRNIVQYSAPILPRPRASEASDLLWPPRRRNGPFHQSIAQNRTVHPTGSENQNYKRKSVGYIKGDGKKAVNDESFFKEGKFGSSSKSSGSIDAYSNDTIPAMQLLSLMDQAIVSGSSFKVAPNNFLDRQFSSCNQHQRFNRNENQKDPFVSPSLFAQSSHNKDFPPLLSNGVRFSGESSKKSSLKGQMPPPKGNSSKAIDLASPSNTAMQPPRDNPRMEICTLNRNPADFSIPDARNEFTLSAKDFKPRKKTYLKERRRPVNVEGQKKQKVRKDSSRKERSTKEMK